MISCGGSNIYNGGGRDSDVNSNDDFEDTGYSGKKNYGIVMLWRRR